MPPATGYFQKTGRRISFEYAMIDGVNDHDWQADLIARRIAGMPGHVNLIPLNDVVESPFKPSRRIAAAFQKRLESHGVTATVRRSLAAISTPPAASCAAAPWRKRGGGPAMKYWEITDRGLVRQRKSGRLRRADAGRLCGGGGVRRHGRYVAGGRIASTVAVETFIREPDGAWAPGMSDRTAGAGGGLRRLQRCRPGAPAGHPEL